MARPAGCENHHEVMPSGSKPLIYIAMSRVAAASSQSCPDFVGQPSGKPFYLV
jgi:hypothetical protein